MIVESVLWALIAVGVTPQSVPQAAQAQKLPVPDDETLKAAEKKVREAFKQELAKKGAPERIALANKFIQQAAQSTDDAAVRYVLLSEARGQAGDLSTVLRAIEEQERLYDIVASTLKADAISEIARTARTPEAFRQLALRSMEVADEAVAADQYDTAVAIATKADTFARNAKDAPLLARVGDKARDLKELKKEADAVKGHLKTLSTMPDDPAANLAAGKFFCVVKGDWVRGLPMLLKGSDSSLQEVAQWESVHPTKPENQIALADGWWEQAKKQSGLMKARYQGRAVQWYQEAAFGMNAIDAAAVNRRATEYEKAAGHARVMMLFADFVSRLPAEEQIKRVNAKLKELNQGFDGIIGTGQPSGQILDYATKDGQVVGLRFVLKPVKNLWPIRAFTRLEQFQCSDSGVLQDISPLGGLPLNRVDLGSGNSKMNPLADLSPLAGAHVTWMNLDYTLVQDLSPLRGAPLKYFQHQTPPAEMSLAPLMESPLEQILVGEGCVTSKANVEVLKSIKTLRVVNNKPVEEFLKGVK